MEQAIAQQVMESGGGSAGLIAGVLVALYAFDKYIVPLIQKKKNGGPTELAESVQKAVGQVDQIFQHAESVQKAVGQVDQIFQYKEWKGEPNLDAVVSMVSKNAETNRDICQTNKKICETLEKMQMEIEANKCGYKKERVS